MLSRVSVVIPGRCEEYFQRTIDACLENARGDVEVIAVADGYRAGLKDHPRVKVIELEKSVGQRAAYNLGVKNSTGEYVMKLDAHAIPSPGYDEVLKSYCPPKTVVLPEMRRLNAREWTPKDRGHTWFMYPGLDLYCHYWRGYRKRDEAKGEYPEVMTGQGSCWFTTREWNDYIGLLDERVGSWGNVGIEVSLRTWLCGGQQILNKNAWQAHYFRVSEGGFPYPMDGRQVAKAHRFTWENYYFKDDAFEHQTRPFRWYIEHFAPVPSWETYLVDEYTAPRTILYYTDNKLEDSLAAAVQSWLQKVAGPIPIVSVSQKPMSLGDNICVGEKPRTVQSMYQQILAGAEYIGTGRYIYLCEHDVFYHPSHFAKVPKDKGAFYFNQHRYYWFQGADTFYRARGKRAFSQAVVSQEYLVKHCKERLAQWQNGERGNFNVRRFSWHSDRPNVDVRHGDNLTGDGRYKRAYMDGKEKGEKNIGGWGGVKHFQSRVKYKGTMRWDVINFLVDLYGYETYLEIGVKKGDCLKRVHARIKEGVDPATKCDFQMTSDEFFQKVRKKYDVIFIDGLHHHDQVEKDIENALSRLRPGGVVVMHDCSPRNELEQRVPYQGQKVWTGDVWKAFVKYRRRRDLDMYVVDTNNGIGIIRKGKQKPFRPLVMTYRALHRNRHQYLNLKSVRAFKEYENRRYRHAYYIDRESVA